MKYKDNGEWVDINIKALDSLPVGSQIDFSGSTIPTGWEQVNDYSTSEIKTGKKWVNGKDIYRKVTTVSDQNQPHGISNIDTVISIIAICQHNYGQYNCSDGVTIQNTNVWLEGTALTEASNGITIIVEYTKSS